MTDINPLDQDPPSDPLSDEDEIDDTIPKSTIVLDEVEIKKKKLDLMDKLDNLLQLSRTLVDGKQDNKKKKKNKRMSEVEEDEVLLKIEEENEKPVTILEIQPGNIVGEMKKYQIDGLNWLIKLYDNNVNGILADEMGLGKTLQSISMLAYLRQFRNINGPHLVVVPKSTLGNWIREFKRWCPDIKPLRFHGSQEERAIQIRDTIKPMDFDVIVTSYEVAIREKSVLKKIDWHYMIVDEAHRLKNENSVLSQTLRIIECKNRLLLTGTPLQNNLHELWALLNFLLPKVFDSAEEFDSIFTVNQGDEIQNDVVAKLHKILRPFLLRRLKIDVATGLPPKKETILYVGLTEMQKLWYKSIYHKDMEALSGQVKEKGRLLNMVMQLRKCSNHPYLFDGAEDRSLPAYGEHLIDNSGKFKLLDKLLPKLKSQGSRVLIFSQMTRQLDILDDYLIYRGYKSCRIDGNTEGEVRDSHIENFNAPDSDIFVFLLSTRAGGLGINLATADVVILYDSDWNPQMDLQAQDRAHRIGQKKPVNVYRLVTENTIEEQIIERATFKLHLDAVVIQQGRLAAQQKSLSKDDMISMIRFGADQIFRSTENTITDEDIDIILQRGAAKTAELNEKVQALTGDGKNPSLTNFSMANSTDDFYDKKTKDLLFMASMTESLGKRDRKMKADAMGTYNEKQYYHDKLTANPSASGPKISRPRKLISMQDFQFYDVARITELYAIERNYYEMSVAGKSLENIRSLTEEEVQERDRLISEGFADFNKRDYFGLLRSLERFGRHDTEALKRAFPNKDQARVNLYLSKFWAKLDTLPDKEKIIKITERGDLLRAKNTKCVDIITQSIKRYQYPMDELEIKYKLNKGKGGFTEDEDRYLIWETYQVGYGEWELLRKAIQNSLRCRYDYFLKSRSAVELSRRVDILIRLLEKNITTSKPTNGNDVSKSALKRKPEAAAVPDTPSKKSKTKIVMED